MTSFLSQVILAARDAGQLILKIRNKGFETEIKADQSPVTEADRAADALLKKRLLGIEPCGWLSEESRDDKSRLEQQRLWIVDPLDGTKEFMKGIPEYAVAVGLVEAGQPIVGVIHNPASDETFAAERGAGAWLNGRSLKVKERATILASNSEMRRGEFASFQQDWTLKSTGSIAFKLGLVASGAAGVTFSRGPKWEWDVCAGQVIVEEAAGLVTDVFGAPLTYNKDFCKVRGILAGAPSAHAKALQQIRLLGASERMREFPDAPIEGTQPE